MEDESLRARAADRRACRNVQALPQLTATTDMGAIDVKWLPRIQYVQEFETCAATLIKAMLELLCG